jgi:Family of unknown function (DUF6335)
VSRKKTTKSKRANSQGKSARRPRAHAPGSAPAPEPRRSDQERPLSEEQLQGPPAAQVLDEPSDLERARLREAFEYSATSPKLTAGDPDADWQRAHMSGEEAVGGTVLTPDQNVVDDLGSALGVPRALDEELRSSVEILKERDARRGHNEE